MLELGHICSEVSIQQYLDLWKNNPCIKNGGEEGKQINIYIHTEERQLSLLGKRCEIT
jgi:hypothetical protein